MHRFEDKAWQIKYVFEMSGQNSREFYATKKGGKILAHVRKREVVVSLPLRLNSIIKTVNYVIFFFLQLA